MKDILRYLLCGLAMGATDVVPGVSGGTTAFILGIYKKLLDAIQTVDIVFFRLFFTGHFREALGRVPWSFLLPLGCGIAISIFSLAKFILYLLATHPVVIWSFFFGLIVASVVILVRNLEYIDLPAVLAFALGAAFAWWLTGVESVTMGHSMPNLFVAGFVAICAMILPGLSGAFVLVLLGQYQFILHAVVTFNIPVLVVFALGCICGLLFFARILNALLTRFPVGLTALLIGMMTGSLRIVWPWHAHNYPALPPALDFTLVLAIICCVVGITLPIVLNELPKYMKMRGCKT